jgi:type IV secretory pathway protease TraF
VKDCRLYFAAVTFLFFFCLLYPFLYYNMTRSVPTGFYWCKPEHSTTPLPPGTFVIFVPPVRIVEAFRQQPGHRHEDANYPWLKKVIRQDGDDLFVEGTHPRSFDSHIFGPVPRVAVQRICIPLWTWE